MKLISKIVAAALACSALSLPAYAAGPVKIGISFQELNNPYFVLMQEALKEAAGTINATVVTADAAHDVSKQINDIEDMIHQGINILLINPTDTEGVRAAVQEAHDAGVIVVAIDANAAGPVDTYVGSKNRDAGYKSCKYLADALGGKGDVAIIDGIAVVPIIERVEGCKAALAETPDIKIVTVQNGKQERDTALTVTENIIQAHPNLAGIFSVNDGGAMGVLAAIQSSGKNIKLTSVDGAPENVAVIAKDEGIFIETTAQFPRDQLRIGLALALAKYWGAKVVPSTFPVDVQVVDKTNAGTFTW